MLFWKKEKKRNYEVSIGGRLSRISYSEGARKVENSSEMLMGETHCVIYFSLLRAWEPPYDHEALTAVDRERIRRNITEELGERGLVAEWD